MGCEGGEGCAREGLDVDSVQAAVIGACCTTAAEAIFFAALFFPDFLIVTGFFAVFALGECAATLLTATFFWEGLVFFAARSLFPVAVLVPEDTCKLTACFARATASFAP